MDWRAATAGSGRVAAAVDLWLFDYCRLRTFLGGNGPSTCRAAPPTMTAMPTPLINVSNRLPVTISDSGIKKSSGGLVAALEGLDKAEYTLNWIGWPGGEVAEDRR